MRRDAPGPYSLETLRSTPAPILFGVDARAWRARLVAWFEAETGRALQPAQVETLLIETLAYAMSVLGQEAQSVAEQHLVALAGEAGLARLAPNRSTPRLPAAKARLTLRFSRDGATGAAFIPAGLRVAGAGVVFVTLDDATLAVGQDVVDLFAEAEEAGAAANAARAGDVAAMLDPVAGLAVVNLTDGEGGADEEDVEAWRLRMANAFERISTGGSRAWYRETAMGVSAALVDVAVVRPQPCHIDLYPLTREGPAGPDLRAQVAAAFETQDALDTRFGDLVTVKPCLELEAAPTLTVRGRQMEATVEADARAVALACLDRFDFRDARAGLRALARELFGREVVAGWSQRLGADIAPSEVERLVRRLPGVVDAELTGLAFQTLAETTRLALTGLQVDVATLPWATSP